MDGGIWLDLGVLEVTWEPRGLERRNLGRRFCAWRGNRWNYMQLHLDFMHDFSGYFGGTGFSPHSNCEIRNFVDVSAVGFFRQKLECGLFGVPQK